MLAEVWGATGPGVRTTAWHLLEVLGTGGTRVTLAVEQAGPVGGVMGRFYRRLTDRYLTAEAEGIKGKERGADVMSRRARVAHGRNLLAAATRGTHAGM